jgi:hypothetical protein
MVVKQLQPAHAKASPGVVEIHLNGIMPHWNHPEYIVRIDVYVEIMDLLREIGRSDRTGVEVQSNKSERALVAATVRPDEFPLAESHIRLVRETHRFTGARRAGPAASDMCEAYKPIEVRYL